MLNKFIKELLEKHNRVIVPDLGAFLHKAETPNVIYFNEFLRFNDGLLVDYYAEKENIDKIEAAKKIKSFVDNINKELQAKKVYQLEGVGTLMVDANEKIQLKTDVLKGIKAEAEKQQKPVQEEKAATPAKSTKTKEKEKLVPGKEIELDVSADEQKSVSKTTEEKTPPKQTISEPETPVKKEPEESGKPGWQKPVQSTVFMEKDEVAYERRSNKKLIWGLVIIFILGILTAGYFLYFKKYFIDLSTVNQNKIVNAADTVHIYPKVNKDTVPKVVEHPVEKPQITASGRYYIIAGCFAQEDNAERLVKMLNDKGFNAEKFAQIDDLFFVGVGGSFATRDEANRELRRLKPQIGINIWIKKY